MQPLRQEAIHLGDLLRAFWRRKAAVVMIVAACIAGTWIVGELAVTPRYTASATYLIDAVARDFDVSLRALGELATDDSVMESIARAGGDSPDRYRRSLYVSFNPKTGVLTVSATAPTPEAAQRTIQWWQESFQDQARIFIADRLESEVLQVLSGPVLPTVPSSPRTLLNAAMAAVFGAFAAGLYVMLADFVLTGRAGSSVRTHSQ